jgi:hypothetical protein
MSDKINEKQYNIEEMAKLLFSEPPKESNTIRLISVEDYEDIFYPFEMLLNLYMEGIFMVGFIDLNPWFHSIGIHANLKEHLLEEKDDFTKYYCKIIVKEDPKYKQWFEIKHITKNYHFLSNANILFGKIKIEDFPDIYAIYIRDDTLYTLNFSFRY